MRHPRSSLLWLGVLWLSVLWLGPGPLAAAAQQGQVTVGSKKFTEGVILGEILTHLARDAGLPATHRRELGGTRVLWNALLSGEIDAYVDYTGTLTEEILAGETMRVGTNRGEAIRGEAALREALAQRDIVMSRPLGFNNTYAIGMQEAVAADLGIRQISQLRQHPDLRFGFTNEFMDRGDGWPGLRDHYRLPQSDVRGVDHDLAYRGLEAGTIQVMDLYSTDAEITVYDLRILADDLGYFPAYRPVILMRQALESDLPQVAAAWRQLAGRITEDAMVAMNARARLERVAESRVAADFLAEVFGLAVEAQVETASARFWRNTRQHLFLVGVSLGLAILLAVPLGILAARYPALGQGILALVGIFQTIPSLALLVFMIPLLGIGAPPALAALFLYSLLPIVRNTHAGLMGITAEIRESAAALGLPPGARLRLVELPLASPQILAGIKTSAVINIGTATLGALIGAGGYGQPILTGIRLDDLGLILQGAVPAAGLALLAQGFFDGLERWLVPRGLRLGRRR